MLRAAIMAAVVVLAQGTSQAPSTLIRSVTLVDVESGTARAGLTVGVRGDRIEVVQPDSQANIPKAARVIDGSGMWLIPGLVETHTHITDPVALRRALALGITSALVIFTGNGTPPNIEPSSMQAGIAVPRLHVVGGRFSAEFPGRFVPSAPKYLAPQTVLEAQNALDEVAMAGIRRIKIWQDDGAVWAGSEQPMPTLPSDVVEALVSGAKRRGMNVYVHAWQLRYYRQAIDYAPDAILHPVMDAPLAAEDVEGLKRKRLPWMTTMAQLFYFGDRQGYSKRIVSDSRLTAGLPAATVASLQEEAATMTFPELAALVPAVTRNFAHNLQTIRENTRRVVAGGILLSVGSDRPAGHGTHLEMELMAEAGVSPRAILKAATIGGAAVLNVSADLGSIGPGRLADLVLLGSDPLKDSRNLRDVRFVMKAGHLWSAEELRK